MWAGEMIRPLRSTMPKAIHDKLEREATQKGLTGKRKNAYVYGTLDKIEKGKHKRSWRDRAANG